MKQKSTIKYLTFIFTIVILSIFLVGCQEGNNEESINVTTQSVNENVISDEYEYNLREYTDQLGEYMAEFNMYVRNREMKSDNAIRLYKEGIVFASENMNLNPQTKADMVLDEYMFNANYYFKQLFEYTLKAINTNDNTYIRLGEDALANYNQEISIVRELLVKYGVNN